MAQAPLCVHIYLLAWHGAASVFCLTVLPLIENDSPAPLLLQQVLHGQEDP